MNNEVAATATHLLIVLAYDHVDGRYKHRDEYLVTIRENCMYRDGEAVAWIQPDGSWSLEGGPLSGAALRASRAAENTVASN